MKTFEVKLSQEEIELSKYICNEHVTEIPFSAPAKVFKKMTPPSNLGDLLKNLENMRFVQFVPKQGLFKDASYYKVDTQKIAEYFQNNFGYGVKITGKIGFD